jgi:chemotaxis response regulator CheB
MKARAAAKRSRTHRPAVKPAKPSTLTRAGSAGPKARAKSFPVVGIGASAGGYESFTKFLEKLPVDSGMAFVLVQHLDPKHESKLTELLSRTTRLPVIEVKHAVRVEPDHVYVIPPNKNLAIAGSSSSPAARPTCRPCRWISSCARSPRTRARTASASSSPATARTARWGWKRSKAPRELTFPLRAAIAKALKEHGPVRKEIPWGKGKDRRWASRLT